MSDSDERNNGKKPQALPALMAFLKEKQDERKRLRESEAYKRIALFNELTSAQNELKGIPEEQQNAEQHKKVEEILKKINDGAMGKKGIGFGDGSGKQRG